MNLSPKTATILLIIVSLLIGTITMNLGSDYLKVSETNSKQAAKLECVYVDATNLDDLKNIQIDHISGRISKEEYLQKEKEILN